MPKRALRTLGLWGTTVMLTPSVAFVAGSSALVDDKGAVWWRATRTWAGSLLRVAGVSDLRVHGAEMLDGDAPYILMANHESQLDPLAVIRSSRRPIGFVAKQELKRVPVMGWAMERTGHVFVDRKDKHKAHASMDVAAARIADGRRVCIFPEGTRTQSDALLPFKKGGFVLAVKAGVPIVPVGIAGTRAIMPPHAKLVGEPGPVVLVYGPPIATAGYTIDTKDALMELVRQAITDARTTARSLATT